MEPQYFPFLGNKLKEQDEDSREKSDDSEVEDLDSAPLTSPLLLQRKTVPEERKRPAESESQGAGPATKKQKTEASQEVSGPTATAEAQQEAMLTDQIRRLLRRRPHTTKELLNIIRPQFEKIDKQILVQKLANVLKTIKAKQYRKNNGKKDTLFFSLDQE